MNRGVREPVLPRPHASGPGQQWEVKAGHDGRHSPRMLRSSSRNSSRSCRRASPPHRAVCKGRAQRRPLCGAAPPRLAEGRGEGRGRAAPSIARPAPGCGRPRPAGSPAPAPGPAPSRAAASWPPPLPARAAHWRERPAPTQRGSARPRGRAPGRGRPRRDKRRRKAKAAVGISPGRKGPVSHRAQPRHPPAGPVRRGTDTPHHPRCPNASRTLPALQVRPLPSGACSSAQLLLKKSFPKPRESWTPVQPKRPLTQVQAVPSGPVVAFCREEISA